MFRFANLTGRRAPNRIATDTTLEDQVLAATPPMGWNSWNTFGPNIDEVLVDETATALVDRGLLAAGYDTLVIDDGCLRF